MKKALSFWFLIFPLFISLYAQSDLSNQLFQRGVNLYNQGKYAEAIPIFEQTQMLDESELPESSSRRNYSRLWIASCYCQLGDTAKAREAEPYAYLIPPVDRRLTIESDQLNELGQIVLATGNYEEAIDYFKQCAEIEHKVLGNHNFYANSLVMVANCMINLDNYSEAKSLLRISSSIYEKDNTPYSYYQSQDMLGWCHYALNEFDSAYFCYDRIWRGYNALQDTLRSAISHLSLIQCMQERGDSLDQNTIAALDTIIDIFALAPDIGKHSVNYASALFRKALILYENGDPETEHILKDVKNIWEKNGVYSGYEYDRVLYFILSYAFFGLQSEDTGKMAAELRAKFEQDGLTLTTEYLDIIHIGVLFGYATGQITKEKAIEDEKLIMRITQENIGTDNEYYVRSLQYIAFTYFFNNDKRKAKQFGEEALDIVENSHGQLTPQTVAFVFSLMAYLYADEMESPKAVTMFNRAYQVYQEYNLPYNREYATLLSQITVYFQNIDKLDESIAAGEQLLSLYKHAKWPNDWNYLCALVSLQNVYNIVGNVKRVRKLIAETEQVLLSNPSLKNSNSYYIWHLQNKSNIDLLDGNVDAAFSAAEELKKLAETEDIIDHGLKSMCRYSANSILAQCYLATGDIEQGIRCYQDFETIDYMAGTNDPISHILMEWLNSLSKIATGNYDTASKQISQAMRQYKKLGIMGEYNQWYLGMLNSLIISSWHGGDKATLMNAVAEQNTFLRGFVRSHFQTMTYQERYDFWDKYSEWFNTQLPNITIQTPNDTMRCEAYDALLLAKGLLLNSEIEVRQLIEENGDNEVKHLYAQFIQHKMLLSSSQSNNMDKQEKDSITQAIQQEEKDLMLILADKFGDYTQRLEITWDQVRQHLHNEEAAIEFMLSPLKPDTVVYSALVLRPGYDSPHLISICLENQLKNVTSEDFLKTESAAQLIWEPLEEELQGVSRIYFSPTGLFHGLGIEYLPFRGGRIGDFYSLYRVSSTRELVYHSDTHETKAAILFGGIDYNADAATVAKNNLSMNIPSSSGYRPRGLTNRVAIRDIAPLPETLTEIEHIGATLTNNNMIATLFKKDKGTEECFKAQSGSHPSYLHVATHGFFWDEEQSREYGEMAFLQQALIWTQMDDHSNIIQEDRMLTRSGLLFAGASNTLQGIEMPVNTDDGILTAQEISRLDFRGTDLVVLSACETARGDITGEGVFGLQRGFKKAGVKSLVMSLWSVDDTATRLLMEEFYKNLVERKQSKHESLIQAQTYLANYENGRYADPRYWAAFILLDALD